MNLVLPKHLGIIIDGNRRWAKARGLPPWEGHRAGAKKLEEFLNWCLEVGIPQVSIYTLSTENLNRPKEELKHLFKILEEYVDGLLNDKKKFALLEKYEVRVRFVGELNRLPRKLIKLMGKLMEKTAKYQKRVLNFLVAYGGKSEIVNAVKKLAEEVIKHGKIEITEKDLEKYLYVPQPLDLIIRTGGYQRLSNFLLWQASYAEIYVTKTLWPDFSKKEFMKALRWFSRQQRNFGR
ncbi:MAG: di-trans,poly-cis-decaprenylcistransferase [Candidatus Aenigmarchaeota archaeon]|jgi:tritrans,polycis-undecaprenyl-diphosphate synthase [geranylgeranyl-diphosphate specific]|nr:di-trans,poly-cis-decaprenylcistransferase [Candidatus Aenigmarchaeota archaeon]